MDPTIDTTPGTPGAVTVGDKVHFGTIVSADAETITIRSWVRPEPGRAFHEGGPVTTYPRSAMVPIAVTYLDEDQP